MLIDSHCHLASQKFSHDIDEVIERAIANGVTRQVSLGTCIEDWQPNLDLAAKYPSVHTCLAIHPCDVTETSEEWRTTLTGHLASPQKIAAIGETGLDYFHPAPDGWSDSDYRAKQQTLLRQHFEIAESAGLNIVIHTRDRSGYQSLNDAITIARDFRGKVRPLFHCFLGPIENADAIFELDGIISFTGIATFKNAHDTIEAARRAPADRFMVETDAPYLAPVPHRGKRNEPSFVRHTAEAIADLRGISPDQLVSDTNAVAESFFRF